MRALIVGGSGFVGSHLTPFLVEKGFDVTIMARHPERGPRVPSQVKTLAADAVKPGNWQTEVPNYDVLVNLAGVSVFKRWDEAYKKLLRDTRILSTRNLVDALPENPERKITLINTSGAGYYGFTADEELSESAPPGSDFLAGLARDWEAEALKAKDKGARVVITRFGIILGKGGGALTQMTLPFRFFAGGPLGHGRQWVSWMHIQDLCRAELFLIEHENIEGPVNFSSPMPVRNVDLAKAIGKALNRPAFMPAPSFMIKLVLGEFGSVILEGQRAVPRVLLDSGFTFEYPSIDEALKDLL
ncbi:MAG: TIGR01777 family oxidoreductase [Candidatus Odinarchaeota archaeon]